MRKHAEYVYFSFLINSLRGCLYAISCRVKWNIFNSMSGQSLVTVHMKFPEKNSLSCLIFLVLFTVWKASKYGVFSGPYFHVFGLNTEVFGVNLRIQSEYGKIPTEKTLYLDTFHAVILLRSFKTEMNFYFRS